MHIRIFKLLAISAAWILVVATPASAQEQSPRDEARPFVAALGGAWNLGNGFNPIVKSSVGYTFSHRLWLEGSAWLRWRPQGWCSSGVAASECEDLTTQSGAAIGLFGDLAASGAGASPYIGGSLGWAESAAIGSLHVGVRQEFTSAVGLRLEAVGQAALDSVIGTAYELMGGLYLRL